MFSPLTLVATLSDIYIYDSVGNTTLGSVDVTETANGEYLLTVVTDKAFLEAESTVYPVTVDPTVTISALNSVIEDATLSAVNTTTNYGLQNTLTLGASMKGYIAMKFPRIAENPTYALLDASQITSASINLFCASKGTSTTVYVNQYDPTATISGYWAENAITYKGNGVNYITPACSKNVSATGNVSIEITKLVKAWKNDAGLISKGLLLRINSSNYGNSSYYYNFYSSETSAATQKPFLSITFNDGGIYQIRNKSTGNMMNVKQSGEASGTDIYQYEEDGTVGQAFRLVYNASTDTYRIYAVCSDFGHQYVVSRISEENDIETNAYKSSTGDWKLEYSAGYYKIKLNSATLYMSVSGSSNKSDIYLNSSANTDKEKWSFELIDDGEANITNIDIYEQQTDYTCSMASSIIVLSAFDIDVTAPSSYDGSVDEWLYGQYCSEEAYAADARDCINDYLLENNKNYEYSSRAVKEDIQEYLNILRALNKGCPVVVLFKKPTLNEGDELPYTTDGHFAVISGIVLNSAGNGFNIILKDPFPMGNEFVGTYILSIEKMLGYCRLKTYTAIVSCWE